MASRRVFKFGGGIEFFLGVKPNVHDAKETIPREELDDVANFPPVDNVGTFGAAARYQQRVALKGASSTL